MSEIPARIYVCPDCVYRTKWRWVLKNHLHNVHGYCKRDAAILAIESEYWQNPHYTRGKGPIN